MPSEPATPPPSAQAVSPEARPPLSSTRLPTMKPAKPPKTPTDLVPTDVVLGVVTRGGTGPCYGIVDQDGTAYAVHSSAGLSLREGMTVRVKYQQPTRTFDCGAGHPIQAVHMDILGKK
ncbi:MAG TPA: hypothetical protein VH502_09745 [Actinoplanes sp.]